MKKGEIKVCISLYLLYLHTRKRIKNTEFMKRMKMALIAVMAIVMGTTFTSCLNSDSSPATASDIGNINSLGGYVTSDNGYRLDIQNFTDMKLTDGSYPTRAIFYYQQIEGEDYTTEKNSYKVHFTGYYTILPIGEMPMTEVEKKTLINALGTETWASGYYINVVFNINYDDKTDPKKDFVLCVDKKKTEEKNSGVLYCKLVHKTPVDTGAKTSNLYMSFRLPEKSDLLDELPDLTLSGDNKNIIEIIITAEGANGELTLDKFKAILPN